MSYVQRLYEEASVVGASRTQLRRRLLDARSVLAGDLQPFFKNPTLDFKSKRLIGDGYYLQWINDGITNIGSVVFRKGAL